MAGPTLFVVLAVGLLVYDHLNERLNAVIFWLALGLILTVFARIIETLRKQAELASSQSDSITGLEGRDALRVDVETALATEGDRRALVLLELDGMHAYNDRFGYEAGDQLLRKFAHSLVETISPLGGSAYRIEASRLAALVPAAGHQLGEIVLAATTSLREQEREQVVSSAYGEVLIPDEAADQDHAFRIAGQRLSAHKQRQHRSARRQAHAVLVATVAARWPALSEQLRAIAFRAISLGRRLGARSEEIDDMALAAELHCVGYLALPDSILAKDHALLDAGERELLQRQTIEGERIIGAAQGLTPVAALVRSSSERFDGQGFPDGLAGEAIPLGSRIIAVAVACATAPSPAGGNGGRDADNLAELQRGAGSRFDPAVVRALADELMEEGGQTPPSNPLPLPA